MGFAGRARNIIKNLPTAGAGSGEGRAQLSAMSPTPVIKAPSPAPVVNAPIPITRRIAGAAKVFKNRIIGLSIVFLFSGILKAEVPDLIEKTLLDHVTTVTHFRNGSTDVALVDSVVLIGKYKGRSILDLQFGLSSKTNPGVDETSGGNFLVGGIFKVSSLLKDVVVLPEHWKFLNSIEHGVGYYYDTREKHGYATYSVGLAFGLNPKP